MVGQFLLCLFVKESGEDLGIFASIAHKLMESAQPQLKVSKSLPCCTAVKSIPASVSYYCKPQGRLKMLLKASNCCKYLHTLIEKVYYVNSTAAFMKANLFVITTRYEFYGSISKTSYLIWVAVTTKAVRLSVMHRIHDCFTTCWIWNKQTRSSFVFTVSLALWNNRKQLKELKSSPVYLCP